jgi:TolA-binding protein
MRNILRFMVVALLAGATLAPADKKDDQLLEISRDIGDLSEKVRDLQKSQAAQAKDIESLRGLIQQAVAASAQTSQDMAALKTALTSALNAALADQQTKLSQSIGVPLGSRIDTLSTSVDQLNTSFGAMNDRISALDKKLNNINDKVSTINQPPPQPPSAPAAAVTVPDLNTNSACPGVTKSGLQEAATADYYSAKDELALTELRNYVKCFPMDAWAPNAGYLMGMIYFRGKDYESATEAFQAVIENYPANNQAQDALFQKAKSLEMWPGHKKDAIDAFTEFINEYKVNDNVPAAKAELKKLTTAPSAPGKANAKQRPPASKQQP